MPRWYWPHRQSRRHAGGKSPKPDVTSFFDPATFTASHGHRTRLQESRDHRFSAGFRSEVRSHRHPLRRPRSGSGTRAGLAIEWILETHAHADHLSAAPILKKKLGGSGDRRQISTVQETFGKIFNAGPNSGRRRQFDRLFKDGDSFAIGASRWRSAHARTYARLHQLCRRQCGLRRRYAVHARLRHRASGFSRRRCGHAYRSIQASRCRWETRVSCATTIRRQSRHFAWETTVAERSAQCSSPCRNRRAEFVAMRRRATATLSMPGLILPSMQVNMRGGHLPSRRTTA